MSIKPTAPYLQHSTVGRFFFHIVNYIHITFILAKVQVKTLRSPAATWWMNFKSFHT